MTFAARIQNVFGRDEQFEHLSESDITLEIQ